MSRVPSNTRNKFNHNQYTPLSNVTTLSNSDLINKYVDLAITNNTIVNNLYVENNINMNNNVIRNLSTPSNDSDASTKKYVDDLTFNFKDVKSIINFGGVGDGVTNNHTQFQAAITSLSSGGVLQIPDGDFLIDGTAITITNNITIQGLGENSVITIDNVNFSFIMSDNTIFKNVKVIQKNMSRALLSPVNYTFVFSISGECVIIDNILFDILNKFISCTGDSKIQNCKGYCVTSYIESSSKSIFISDCKFIDIEPSSNITTFSEANGNGIIVDEANMITIENSRIRNMNNSILFIDSTILSVCNIHLCILGRITLDATVGVSTLNINQTCFNDTNTNSKSYITCNQDNINMTLSNIEFKQIFVNGILFTSVSSNCKLLASNILSNGHTGHIFRIDNSNTVAKIRGVIQDSGNILSNSNSEVELLQDTQNLFTIDDDKLRFINNTSGISLSDNPIIGNGGMSISKDMVVGNTLSIGSIGASTSSRQEISNTGFRLNISGDTSHIIEAIDTSIVEANYNYISSGTISSDTPSSVITEASTLTIQGPPLVGSNISSIQNNYSLWIKSGDIRLGNTNISYQPDDIIKTKVVTINSISSNTTYPIPDMIMSSLSGDIRMTITAGNLSVRDYIKIMFLKDVSNNYNIQYDRLSVSSIYDNILITIDNTGQVFVNFNTLGGSVPNSVSIRYNIYCV